MERLGYGMIRYLLWRLAGLFAALVFAAFLLTAMLGGPSWPSTFGNLLAFDFGISGQLIGERSSVTLPLALLATIVALVVGVPLGAIAARTPTSWQARLIVWVSRVAFALPPVWVAMLLAIVVAGMLRWLPPGGFVPWGVNFGRAMGSLILPAMALALPLAAAIAATTARTLSGLHESAVVVGARARGKTEQQAMFRLGPRQLAPALLDRFGRGFGVVVAGAMIVETVFYLPGLGRLLLDSVAVHDAVTVRGILFLVISLGALARFAAAALAVFADVRLATATPA